MAKKPSRSPSRAPTKPPTPPDADPADAAAKPVSAGPPPRRERPEDDPPLSDVLDKTVIARPLLDILAAERELLNAEPSARPALHAVIIDLNLEYPGGRREAAKTVIGWVNDIIKELGGGPDGEPISQKRNELGQQYLFAELRASVIEQLVKRDREEASRRRQNSRSTGGLVQLAPRQAIFHIWPDFEVYPLINRSVSTVKADAARNAFGALGEGVVWAVLDSGVDRTHPHFKMHENLILGDEKDALKHRDFTSGDGGGDAGALVDRYGHGTHVAAIIAGEMNEAAGSIEATVSFRNEVGQADTDSLQISPSISGMAPKCKLISLKILDNAGKDKAKGRVSNIIAAIDYIQEVNGFGRRIRIHGVNMSVGYDFEPRWFACGQSPLCVEVDRLVKSGVVVVVAAGNTGYASTLVADRGAVASGMDLTINDPGNAGLAITVGSTHRDMPHVYGVSYFSSKGPTGDGRLKPDLVAPGEKIISADSAQRRSAKGLSADAPIWYKRPDGADAANQPLHAKYREDTGTSMAAPHVSGVIAAFLSVRGEFIGRAEQVKEIFCSAATDLKRERYFQGNGLVDLMRAIQSI